MAKNVQLRRAISLGIAALIVVALIIAVGFGLYFSTVLNEGNSGSRSINPGGTSTFSTQTTSTSENYPTSAKTTNSTLGLELLLSTNNTSLESGQAMNVSLSVINTLSSENNVSSASDWKISQLENHTDTALHCIGWANFLVYRGYYTESNLSAGAISIVPLTQPGVGYNCSFYGFSLYSFQPSSSEAATYGGGGPTNMSYSYGTSQLTVGSVVSGYYTADQSYYNLNEFVPPSPFPTAVYTIVAGDQWGQLVILHFTVEPNSTSSTPISFVQGSTSICPSSCLYPSPYLSAGVLVNSTSPLRSLQLYINGTYEGTSSYSNNFTTAYVIQYKSNPTNQTLPIAPGKAYEITLTATFQDNSTSSASTVVISSSGSLQTSTDLVCVTTNYQVLGIESITVQNGTTTTLPVRTTTTSTVESTVTTTTNVTETVSYVTATTSYSPPSSWTVVSCTYVKG